MSLDLTAEGMAYTGTKIVGTAVGLAAVTLADFDTGSEAAVAPKLIAHVNNSGTPSANVGTDLPIPSALGVVGGTVLVLVNDTNGKKITFVDPFTGITFDYCNRIGESVFHELIDYSGYIEFLKGTVDMWYVWLATYC